MNPLYNLAIGAMAGACEAASRLGHRKMHKMVRGQERTLRILARKLQGKEGPVWFHAASLGEFEQGRPMIERLRREHPEVPILLTFFSPSGLELRKNYPFVDAVAYLPFDTPKAVGEFLDLVKPSKAIFIKYEFWGNYLEQLRKRGVPTYIISAIFRPKQAFFRPYGGMFRKMLGCFDRLYVQDEDSRRLLAGIGIDRVTVAGDTRFDRVTDVMRSRVDIPGFPGFAPNSKLKFIAGSSWEPDEDIYVPWLKEHPEVAFIIAPHEFNEARLEALRNRFPADKGHVVMLSEWVRELKKNNMQITGWLAEVRGIIVDSFGKLSSLYRFADLAYIGGGFGVGIHNINEAAVYSIPVVFGPKHAKFREASDLIRLGGGFSIGSAGEFAPLMERLMRPEVRQTAGSAAGAYVKSQLGATDLIYRDLFA